MLLKYLLFVLVNTSVFSSTYILKPIEITKDVHCVIGDFNLLKPTQNKFISNICYIDIGDSIVLLDAGPSSVFAKELYTLIKKNYPNKSISTVVLSNYHPDKTTGALFFRKMGAKIIAHKTILLDMSHFKYQYKDIKPTKPDILVDNGYIIKGTTKTLQIIKPSIISQERSDIAIYSKYDDFIFAGNMIYNNSMLHYTEISHAKSWIEALEKIKSMNVKYIIGSQGKEYGNKSYQFTLEYLNILTHDVQKAYNNNIPRDKLSNYVKTHKFKYLKNFTILNNNAIQMYYNQLQWDEY